MVCEIMRDEDFLKQVSEPATQADIPVADDLLETLIAHKDGCVGMVGGVRYRIALLHDAADGVDLVVPQRFKGNI